MDGLLHFRNFWLPLPSLSSNGLNCGVMVTQQILVLSFWVRVPAVQPRKRDLLGSLFCFYYKVP